jgi:hypothetical protein
MLEFFRDTATDRKLMTAHGRDPAEIESMKRESKLAARAAAVAERLADGRADLAEMSALFTHPADDEMEGCYADGPDAAWAAKATAYRARHCAQYVSPASYPRRARFRSASPRDHFREQHAQSELLRDIFGNPFLPVAVDPAWLTPAVFEQAEAIYRERAFDRLPELAGALEQAGCANLWVLHHCGRPGEHVRGCWVVDLLLGMN